jgi:hypothetical protein
MPDGIARAERLHGFEAIALAEAVRWLAGDSPIADEEDILSEIAAALGCEPPALRWAAGLARRIGWRPLRPRLLEWSSLATLLGESELPWREDVGRVLAGLPAAALDVLRILAACDARFSWDVLEAVAGETSIENICLLEDAALLTRRSEGGIVTFAVPYCVRAVVRLSAPDGATAEQTTRWLEAWAKRAEELRHSSYGSRARATLVELAAAVPLAERALHDADRTRQTLGLAVWTATSDAMFFAGAIDFRSPTFTRAVTVADAYGTPEQRVRARLIAARARLEQGDPAHASLLAEEGARIADGMARDDLRSEALRAVGWADLASARVDAARSPFQAAQRLSEASGDPRGQADAMAGLGVLALLAGEPHAARSMLAEAMAIHVVMRDAPREVVVRGMMELLPEQHDEEADLARLADQVEQLRASGQRWREALALGRLGLAARARGETEAAKTHLLEARTAAALSSMPASKLASALVDARGSTAALVVGVEGRSLTLPSGESHDLARHGPLRRILWALATARCERPGIAMSTLEVVAAGWPGEKMKHEAATLRVYTTVRRLRGMGLAEALLTRDDGYLLDPEVAVTLGT